MIFLSFPRVAWVDCAWMHHRNLCRKQTRVTVLRNLFSDSNWEIAKPKLCFELSKRNSSEHSRAQVWQAFQSLNVTISKKKKMKQKRINQRCYSNISDEARSKVRSFCKMNAQIALNQEYENRLRMEINEVKVGWCTMGFWSIYWGYLLMTWFLSHWKSQIANKNNDIFLEDSQGTVRCIFRP